jgi:hypothetical protein
MFTVSSRRDSLQVGELPPIGPELRTRLKEDIRQLSQAQVRELIAWELRRQPQTSDRGLGLNIGVDNKTVAGVRRQLEAGEEIPHLTARSGLDGKTYRKPIVFTYSNAQAVEAQHLLQELGDDVPDGPLSVKKLRRMKSARLVERHISYRVPVPDGSVPSSPPPSSEWPLSWRSTPGSAQEVARI